MKNPVITENYEEKIKLGRQYFQEHKEVYNERMMRILNKSLDEFLPNATEEEREKALYHAIYDYWIYGNNISEEFFFDFVNKTHEEKCEYITFRNRFRYMNRLNSQETRHYLDNKWDAYQLMKPYYRREAVLLRDENDYELFCRFVEKHPEFVVKPIGLCAGAGVHKESVINRDVKEVFRKILDEKTPFAQEYPSCDTSAMMVEELIVQDKEMAALHPASVQSIRLVTVKVGEEVHIWYPRIDIGRGGSFLINGDEGGIMACIDPKTGVIINKGRPESGESYEYHPETGVRILGFQIPRWDELVKMATEIMLHVLPDTCYVGWDMALSEKGWCVVEGNWAGEFIGDQLGYGRGLRREFESLIGWKPTKAFWWEKE